VALEGCGGATREGVSEAHRDATRGGDWGCTATCVVRSK
jgi:hypothetical protein